MILSQTRSTRIFLIILFFFTLLFPLFSQQVVLNIKSIKYSEKGFLVKGTVVMSNLNPGGQIVESDSCSIVADIKLATDSEFPTLPDTMIVRVPPNVETSFRKGGKFLTKKEFNGVKVAKYVIFRISPRGESVWRDYGGLGVWRKKAPNCVTQDFEGIIPKIYAGKTVRIRASLRHQWGGPWVPWSAYSFHHDIGHKGILRANHIKKPESHKLYIESGPSGRPNPAGIGIPVKCRISAKDTKGHKILYNWSVKPQAGSFSDPQVQNPVWNPPVNSMGKMRSYTISCLITCSEDNSLKETGSFVQDLCPEIKPVSVKLRISSDGFNTYELKTRSFIPRYKRLIMTGSVMPVYRNSTEAGTLGSGNKVLAELIVMSDGKEVRANRVRIDMYSDYWLSVDLSEFAGCTKKEKTMRKKNIRLKPTGNIKENKESKDVPDVKEIYDKILSGKYEKKGFKKIWQILGLYKAYMNDKDYIKSGGKGTPALDTFFKNLQQGHIGEIKNAVNTLWEFTKDPLTLGGSAIEDMIQNTNRAWERIFGKGFLKKQMKVTNSLKEAGAALKNKLEQLQRVLEAE